MSATSALLEARGLRLAFGGVRAADGVDLDVLRGEFLAIIGPNGAGKTTFINMATGYLRRHLVLEPWGDNDPTSTLRL